jgi:putative heme-binding domain-containing protein
LVSCFPPERATAILCELLDEQHTQAVQLAAVRALADGSSAAVSSALLRYWQQYLPAVRTAALEALLSREAWTLDLLRAAENGDASLTHLDSTRRNLLLNHRRDAISKLAGKLFGNSAGGGSPQALIADYQAALRLDANASQGHELFRRLCSACHKIGNEGAAVGPDLSASATRDPAALLTHILDPNQYVLPNYQQYLIADKNGRTFTGLIAAETATSITLRRDSNIEDTILRSDIEQMTNTGKSLMPDGFDRQLSKQDMADLLAYLGSVQLAPPLDIGTRPGLVEPDRRP